MLYDGDAALVRTADEVASLDLANLAAILETIRDGFDETDAPMLRQINGSLSEVELRASGFSTEEVDNVTVGDSVLSYLASVFEARGG